VVADHLRTLGLKNPFQLRAPKVHLVKSRGGIHIRHVAGGQVVDDDDLHPLGQVGVYNMRADEAGPSRYQSFHAIAPRGFVLSMRPGP
jgi:hypothetical protein